MTHIEPIFDSEDDLWFAGIWTGMPTGPWSQRGEFYAWPDPRRWQSGTATRKDGAEAYATREECERACAMLNAMSINELRELSPDFFGAEPDLERARR